MLGSVAEKVVRIDLSTGDVSTLAGTGCQGNDKEGGGVGIAQALSSPWDLEMGKSPGSTEDEHDIIYIAMAGTHQLWIHFLNDTTWSKGRYGSRTSNERRSEKQTNLLTKGTLF